MTTAVPGGPELVCKTDLPLRFDSGWCLLSLNNRTNTEWTSGSITIKVHCDILGGIRIG